MKNFVTYYPFLLFFLFISILNSTTAQDKDLPYQNPGLPVEKRVDDLLNRMTLKEKFWQMFMIPGDLSNGKEKYKHGIFGFQVAAAGEQTEAAGQMLDYGPSGTAKQVAEKINRSWQKVS